MMIRQIGIRARPPKSTLRLLQGRNWWFGMDRIWAFILVKRIFELCRVLGQPSIAIQYRKPRI